MPINLNKVLAGHEKYWKIFLRPGFSFATVLFRSGMFGGGMGGGYTRLYSGIQLSLGTSITRSRANSNQN